eukprot:scaffold1158_cov46-Cyclotella_meneghiniana.AAC.1
MADRALRPSSSASAASSTPSIGFTALDNLMDELQVSSAAPAATAKPAGVGRLRREGKMGASTPRTSVPPPVSLVAALGSAVSSLSSSRRVRIQGHLEGESYEFCLKPIDDVLSFCCKGHKGDKFSISKSMLYIEMANDTALCQPCISKDQLEVAGMSYLLSESHSSREWSKLVDSALEAVAASPSSKEDSGSASLKFDDEVSPVKKAPVAKRKEDSSSASAVDLLKSYSGVQALKSLLPLSAGLFGKSGLKSEEAAEETVEFEEDADVSLEERVETLGEFVHSMYETLPVGLQEVDSKFNKAVQLMEQRQSNFSDSLGAVQQDLFGTDDPEDLIGSFPSFGRGLNDAVASVDSLGLRLQSVENVSES